MHIKSKAITAELIHEFFKIDVSFINLISLLQIWSLKKADQEAAKKKPKTSAAQIRVQKGDFSPRPSMHDLLRSRTENLYLSGHFKPNTTTSSFFLSFRNSMYVSQTSPNLNSRLQCQRISRTRPTSSTSP